MRIRCTLVSLALGLSGLRAGAIYNLRDGRYFPDGPGIPDNEFKSGVFASSTSDSLQVSYSSNGNAFDGLATVGTGPFTLGTYNAVTIGSATTTFNNLGIYSIVESGIEDTAITITGGSGTGYLLPTFHVQGILNDSNPNADVGDLICAGNGVCILSSIFGTFTSGVHNVNGVYTPSIGSDTSFQFGTPFDFFFFFGSGIQELGSTNPGGPVIADLTLQLVGMQVVDGSGQVIRGAQIHSPFLDAVNAPEPGTAGTGLAALAVLGAFAVRKNRAEYRCSLRSDSFRKRSKIEAQSAGSFASGCSWRIRRTVASRTAIDRESSHRRESTSSLLGHVANANEKNMASVPLVTGGGNIL